MSSKIAVDIMKPSTLHVPSATHLKKCEASAKMKSDPSSTDASGRQMYVHLNGCGTATTRGLFCQTNMPQQNGPAKDAGKATEEVRFFISEERHK